MLCPRPTSPAPHSVAAPQSAPSRRRWPEPPAWLHLWGRFQPGEASPRSHQQLMQSFSAL
jgi:hypothetical protein